MSLIIGRLWSARAAKSVAAAGCALAISVAPACAGSRQDQAANTPPAGQKIVLFSGNADEVGANWYKRGTTQPGAWRVEDGAMTAGGGDIITKQVFNDFYLHLEFKEPQPKPNQHGQDRGNSGVGLLGIYEIQVLDSYGFASPGTGDCGAVYDTAAPLFNACKPPLEWQTYDIFFRAPRWDASGKKTEDARVTVLQNGTLVQNNTDIPKPTGIGGRTPESPNPGPIDLQDHGHPVQYRNIWIIPLPPHGSPDYAPH